MDNMTQTNALCHPSQKEISTQTEAVCRPSKTENRFQTDKPMKYERHCHTWVVFHEHQVASVAVRYGTDHCFTSPATACAQLSVSTSTVQSTETSSVENEAPRTWQNNPYQPNLWSILRDKVPDERPCSVTQANNWKKIDQCQTKQFSIESKSNSEDLNPRRNTQRQLDKHRDSNMQDLLHSNCVQCSRPWSMTTTNATWYIEHEMQVPKRCIQCRATPRNRARKKLQRSALIPSQEVKITEHPILRPIRGKNQSSLSHHDLRHTATNQLKKNGRSYEESSGTTAAMRQIPK